MKINQLILIIGLVAFGTALHAQRELSWKTLAEAEFNSVLIEEIDAYFWQPTFNEKLKSLEGEEVFITGYVIPVDYDANYYVLSRFPFANCFFCGGAGPESVIDLRFVGDHRAYKTDERLSFYGKLKLNDSDIYQMTYILEDAKQYK